MVPMTGLEPVRISSEDFKSTVSANSTTSAKNKERMCKLRTCVSTSYVAYYHYTIESTSFKRNQPTGELPIPSIMGHVIWTKKREGVLLHAPFQNKRKSFRSNNQISTTTISRIPARLPATVRTVFGLILRSSFTYEDLA